MSSFNPFPCNRTEIEWVLAGSEEIPRILTRKIIHYLMFLLFSVTINLNLPVSSNIHLYPFQCLLQVHLLSLSIQTSTKFICVKKKFFILLHPLLSFFCSISPPWRVLLFYNFHIFPILSTFPNSLFISREQVRLCFSFLALSLSLSLSLSLFLSLSLRMFEILLYCHYSQINSAQEDKIFRIPPLSQIRMFKKWLLSDKNIRYDKSVCKQIIIYSLEFFISASADGLSLELEWQQVSSSLQDSSQYFVRSQ